MQINEIQAFCLKIYEQALNKAELKNFEQGLFREDIQTLLKSSKIPFIKLKPYILSSKKQWIEDLIETTKDIRLVLSTGLSFRKRLENRAEMHFTNSHKQFFSSQSKKSTPTKHIISMYNQSQPKNFKLGEIPKISDQILQNSVYLVGLVKGNGVIVEKDSILSCAHAFMDEQQNLIRFKCFVTGSGSYGILKVEKDGIFTKEDVGIATIIRQFKAQSHLSSLFLSIPTALKFKSQFNPIRCIQVGLLLNNEPQQESIKPFETSQGFIERNLYQNINDHKLVDEMGLLIHDCYGLWGTSGSPLWTQQGQLLGIHNAWNQNGYNVSMIVHDDETTDCRVVKQYERRAIGVHVLKDLFEKWRYHQKINLVATHFERQKIDHMNPKKKFKLLQCQAL